MSVDLLDIEFHAQQVEAAREALKLAVVRAHKEGASVTAIAEAAGVGRQTIYRWLGEETNEFAGRPIDALRASLEVLARAILDPRAAADVRRRLGGSEVSLSIAFRIASEAIGRQATQERPATETRIALAAGAAALDRLERVHKTR